MGKFEKGQYVRRVSGSSFTTLAGRHCEGFIGQIKEVVAKGYDELIFTNGHRGIADGYEPWTPKVGDRVTGNDTTRVNIERHWNEHFRRSVGDIVDGALVVTSVADHGGSNVGLSNKIGRAYFFMSASALKPVAPVAAEVKAAALSIEAGKFYKTRDGRKVGPMEKIDYTWPFPGAAEGSSKAYYNADGSCPYIPEDDLIAEWVDEPVVQPAKASNDNAEPAKPKFKVGDRVKTKGWARFYEIAEVEGTDIHVILYDGTTSKEYTEGREFEFEATVPPTPAIVALIENGTAKPASRPKVHADQASATTEAERLALEFPGQQFGVFVLADSKIADVVNVPTAVLRGA